MTNRINRVPTKRPATEMPTVIDERTNPAEEKEKKLQSTADRAAHKAARTEQDYDPELTTFSG